MAPWFVLGGQDKSTTWLVCLYFLVFFISCLYQNGFGSLAGLGLGWVWVGLVLMVGLGAVLDFLLFSLRGLIQGAFGFYISLAFLFFVEWDILLLFFLSFAVVRGRYVGCRLVGR